NRIRVLAAYRSERTRLLAEAERFGREIGSDRAPIPRRPGRPWRFAAGFALAGLFALAAFGATRIGHGLACNRSAFLVISFKHPGQSDDSEREPPAEELAKLPRHMRAKQICERRRAAVRARVRIDGREAFDRSYEPRGIWHDGNSIAIEQTAV